MALSYFLAQLMGVALVLFSIAGLMRPQLISSAVREMDHEAFSTFFVGFTAVLAGLAVVLTHNIWDGTWRTWITLLGWVSLVKGFLYMAAPKSLTGMGRSMLRSGGWIRTLLIATLILGCYLAAKGFGWY